MNENKTYRQLIATLNDHILGKKKLTNEELEQIGMDIEVDIPYSDDWVSHGYSSYKEWYNMHKDFLNDLHEVIKLYKSIPEVKDMQERQNVEHLSSVKAINSTNAEKHSFDNDANDVLIELGL